MRRQVDVELKPFEEVIDLRRLDLQQYRESSRVILSENVELVEDLVDSFVFFENTFVSSDLFG